MGLNPTSRCVSSQLDFRILTFDLTVTYSHIHYQVFIFILTGKSWVSNNLSPLVPYFNSLTHVFWRWALWWFFIDFATNYERQQQKMNAWISTTSPFNHFNRHIYMYEDSSDNYQCVQFLKCGNRNCLGIDGSWSPDLLSICIFTCRSSWISPVWHLS